MDIFVFGNPDYQPDALAIQVAQSLQPKLPDINFIFLPPNQEVPFAGLEQVYLLDVVKGLPRVQILTDQHLDQLVMASSATVHDYDLGFQLKYLQKLGKLGTVSIIGIPIEGGEMVIDDVEQAIQDLVSPSSRAQ